MKERAIDVRGLVFRYGAHLALDAVDLQVNAGDLVGLLGPNGGGKTTLFRILTTLLRPAEGDARVFGEDVVSRPAAVRQRLGVVFQHAALDEDLSVMENLQFHGALYGISGLTLRDRAKELLSLFGIEDRARSRTKTLSGGLKRRVDLARALLHRPSLLLLDEPTTGLDPAARYEFWQLLSHIRLTEGTTILAATHLLEEAEDCDTVTILDRGRVVATGEPDVLRSDLGGETLWLESPDPTQLRDAVQAQFGLEAVAFERAVQISHSSAHRVLASLYDAFGSQITSATVRRPTLEDVFLVRTGRQMQDSGSVPVAQ